MEYITINMRRLIDKMTDDQFYEFCQDNREARFERNQNGEIIIMSPTGGNTGRRNSK